MATPCVVTVLEDSSATGLTLETPLGRLVCVSRAWGLIQGADTTSSTLEEPIVAVVVFKSSDSIEKDMDDEDDGGVDGNGDDVDGGGGGVAGGDGGEGSVDDDGGGSGCDDAGDGLSEGRVEGGGAFSEVVTLSFPPPSFAVSLTTSSSPFSSSCFGRMEAGAGEADEFCAVAVE